MKVVIIEDEPLTANRLKAMLQKMDSTTEVQAVLPSIEEAVDWFKNNPSPELVFMDIHLEDGQSFTIFETINLEVPVIFTTAYDEYMIKAFKVNSVDYLMKPLNYDELVQAVDKFKKYHTTPASAGSAEESNDLPPAWEPLLRSIRGQEVAYKERFLISIGSRLRTIDVADIHYFYSAEKLTFLVTADGQKFPMDNSLDKLQLQLNPRQFFRVNRQMMVKLTAIENIHVYPKGRLKLDLKPHFKEDVMVSLDRVTEFKDWLGR
ncbi:MAG TPA: LytTR family DNA-binding domain-containing protein [Phnomibacter sp.]|nr:LytTR family DNA-binding domain-containing protein [Phnomibacter sp.]